MTTAATPASELERAGWRRQVARPLFGPISPYCRTTTIGEPMHATSGIDHKARAGDAFPTLELTATSGQLVTIPDPAGDFIHLQLRRFAEPCRCTAWWRAREGRWARSALDAIAPSSGGTRPGLLSDCGVVVCGGGVVDGQFGSCCECFW